jgi:CubicO group peptidase (beta-lactamase class C family)
VSSEPLEGLSRERSDWRGGVAEWVQTEIEAGRLASLSLSVVRDGVVLLEMACGSAHVEAGRPATVDTAYCLGSVAKVMTATGVLALVERGTIDLDQPLNRYLNTPVCTQPYPPESVTVRKVLSHTAGFSEHLDYTFEDEGQEPPAMDEVVRRFGVVAFPPGERFRYSNLGYGILGHLIESVAGMPLWQFMAEVVFVPLGMTNSLVGGSPLARERIARGHDERLQRIPFYRADLPSACQIWSSVRDLSRFAAFHLGRRLPDQLPILRDDLRRQMQRVVVAVKPGVSMGLGWFLVERNLKLVKHEGRTCGATASLWLFPDEGLSIAVAANSRSERVWELTEQIALGALASLAPWKPPSPAGETSSNASRPERLSGNWTGAVSTPDGEVDMILAVGRCGHTVCRLGRSLPTILSEETSDGVTLHGRMPGDLRTSDDRKHPHAAELVLDLLLVDGELRGALVVVFPSGHRSGDDYSYPVRLRRDP